MPAKKQFTEEEARERKNSRQREYARRTGYAANKKYNQNSNYDNEYKKQFYKRYTIFFNNEKDKEILDFIESYKSQGLSATEILRMIFRDINNKQ